MSVQYLIGRLEGAQPPQDPGQVGATSLRQYCRTAAVLRQLEGS
jgi:hypothetical protein